MSSQKLQKNKKICLQFQSKIDPHKNAISISTTLYCYWYWYWILWLSVIELINKERWSQFAYLDFISEFNKGIKRTISCLFQ